MVDHHELAYFLGGSFVLARGRYLIEGTRTNTGHGLQVLE